MEQFKIICTLGPSSLTPKVLKRFEMAGITMVKLNLCHTPLDAIESQIRLVKETINTPLMIDLESSQIRTTGISSMKISEHQNFRLVAPSSVRNENDIPIRPAEVITQLQEGDLIAVDKDTVLFRVTSVSNTGYVDVAALNEGVITNNKSVHVLNKKVELPLLSEKDKLALQLVKQYEIACIGLSFTNSEKDILTLRKEIEGTSVQVMAKIETALSLENLDRILAVSDMAVLDRHDLNKEIPLECIPLVQKLFITRCIHAGIPGLIAPEVLSSTVEKVSPTCPEVNDLVNMILDGAGGTMLTAETSVSKHPIKVVNVLLRVVSHTISLLNTFNDREAIRADRQPLIKELMRKQYLEGVSHISSLVSPHGGKLVDRTLDIIPKNLTVLPRLLVGERILMDAEQIAIGTFSPLTGFLGKEDFQRVLESMHLKSGVIWPVPIIFAVDRSVANQYNEGEDIALVWEKDKEIYAILHLEEKFTFDKKWVAKQWFGTDDISHQGVKMLLEGGDVALGGDISLVRKLPRPYLQYELTPRQVRCIFNIKGWSRVIGFNTRNVIHRGHEYLQITALLKENCDGLFVQPVIGKKKEGDFHTEAVIRSYEIMTDHVYKPDQSLFSVYSLVPRYSGPKDAILSAICKKNYGCSHLIVGRDHAGVGNFYTPTASQEIFARFPDLGITPVFFGNIVYDPATGEYRPEEEVPGGKGVSLSGTKLREMLRDGSSPPEWFMRKEISEMLIERRRTGKPLFEES